jgi:ABC-type nitrate/sulfonate/bicarbonate transport system permease component
VLGVGQGMQIAVIAFGVCFPVLVNTVEGVRAVSPEAATRPRCCRRPRGTRLRIYFPAALPSIVAGLRVAVSIGLVLVVISGSSARVTGSGATSGLCEASSSTPRCTRRSSSSVCSDTR